MVKGVTLALELRRQSCSKLLGREGFNSAYSDFQTSLGLEDFFIPTKLYMVPNRKADLPPSKASTALLSSLTFPEPADPLTF